MKDELFGKLVISIKKQIKTVVRGQMLIILSEHASIYREKPMKNSSEKPMKKGLYGSQCLLARMLARGPVRRLRSFGASRAKPETNIGFNPLHIV